MSINTEIDLKTLDYIKTKGPEVWHGVGCNWDYHLGNESIKFIVSQKSTYLSTTQEIFWDFTFVNAYLDKKPPNRSDKDTYPKYLEVVDIILKNIIDPTYYSIGGFLVDFYGEETKEKNSFLPQRLRVIQSDLPRFNDYFKAGVPDEILKSILNKAEVNIESKGIKNKTKYWVTGVECGYYRSRDMQSHILSILDLDGVELYNSKNERTSITDITGSFSPIDEYKNARDDLIFRIEIDNRWPKRPDVYISEYGSDTSLYSKRYLDILESFGIKVIKYKTELFDTKGVLITDHSYSIARIEFPYLDALDSENSLWLGIRDFGVPQIILKDELVNKYPIVKLAQIYTELMRDDLVQKLFSEKISGMYFIDAEKYTSHYFGSIFYDEDNIIRTL